MSNSNLAFFTQQILTSSAHLTSGVAWTVTYSATTNMVPILTAGTNGSRVTSVLFTSTDASTDQAVLVLDPGGSATSLGVLGQIPVSGYSGTGGFTPAIDGLSTATTPGTVVDNNGKHFLHLAANDKLWFGVISGMTAGKTLFVTTTYENY